MVYLLFVLIFTLLIAFSRRRVGLAILVMLVASFVINLWIDDLTRFFFGAQIGLEYKVIRAIIEIVAVVVPTSWAVLRSTGSSRKLVRRLFESCLFSVLFVYLLRTSISNIIALDYKSIELAHVLIQFEKILLTVTGVFGIKDILGKIE